MKHRDISDTADKICTLRAAGAVTVEALSYILLTVHLVTNSWK